MLLIKKQNNNKTFFFERMTEKVRYLPSLASFSQYSNSKGWGQPKPGGMNSVSHIAGRDTATSATPWAL